MKLAVFGNFGVRNLGDDLILQGFLEQYKDDEVLVFCGNPEGATREFKLSAYNFFPAGFRSHMKYLLSSESQALISQLELSDNEALGLFYCALLPLFASISIYKKTAAKLA